jgi:ATP-binding cassette subfamily F protein 3
VLQFFREEARLEEGAARKQLARFLFYGADVFKQVRNLSGGEWTRLRLALLMLRKPNLLLLDEPTNHLDIDSREALEEALEEFPGTLLCISHDRYLINRLARRVWALEGGTLTAYHGDFEYYKEKRAELGVPKAEAPAGERKVAVAKAVDVGKMAQQEPLKQQRKRVNPYVKAKVEEQIAEKEARLLEIDSALGDPDHATDAGLLIRLLAEKDVLQAELDGLLERWMQMEE